MIQLADNVQRLLSDAIAENLTEPAIVKQFTEKVGVIKGAFDGGQVTIRSKFIHQRPYAFFVEPPRIEGKGKTELGDILFVVKERIGRRITRRRMVILQVKMADANGKCAISPHQHAFQRDLYSIAFRFGNRYYADRWHPIIWTHLSKTGRLMANLVLHRKSVSEQKTPDPVVFRAAQLGRYRDHDFRHTWFPRFADSFAAFCAFEGELGVAVSDPLDTMLKIIYKSGPVDSKAGHPEEWQEYFCDCEPGGGWGIVEMTISKDGPSK